MKKKILKKIFCTFACSAMLLSSVVTPAFATGNACATEEVNTEYSLGDLINVEGHFMVHDGTKCRGYIIFTAPSDATGISINGGTLIAGNQTIVSIPAMTFTQSDFQYSITVYFNDGTMTVQKKVSPYNYMCGFTHPRTEACSRV